MKRPYIGLRIALSWLAILMAFVVWVALFSHLGAQTANAPRSFGWGITHTPAANTAATISRAALTSQRHVADCVSMTFNSNALDAAIEVQINLRDGATGAGTILQSWEMSTAAATGGGPPPIAYCGLGLPGTIGTAMTLEFTAAGGANTFESVALKGHDE